MGALKYVNKYGINEIDHMSRIDVTFFARLLRQGSFDRLKFVYLYVADQLELADVSNVLKVIAQDEEVLLSDQLALMSDMLRNPKTASMFNSALKMDKELFTQKLSKMVQDDDFFPIR